MRHRITIALFGALIICMGMVMPAFAGKFVTDLDRSWAKKALQDEKAISGDSKGGRTLAVFYFQNKTDWQKLDLLQKGLTLMLITDLSKVKGIRLVERVKIQALVEEMGFGVSGLVTPDSAPRVGRILGASLLVGGDIGKGKERPFSINSEVLSVPTENPIGTPSVGGNLLDGIFQMEKDLVFEIIELLKIELTPELKELVREPITNSLDALLLWFQAMEEGDQGNFDKAKDLFDKTLEEDPDFPVGLLGFRPTGGLGKAGAWSDPESGPGSAGGRQPGGGGGQPSVGGGGSTGGKACAAQRNKILRNAMRKRRF